MDARTPRVDRFTGCLLGLAVGDEIRQMGRALWDLVAGKEVQ